MIDRLVEIVLFNAASATVLAFAAALVTPQTRRSAITHFLWLVVLLKLVSPPLVEFGAIPSPSEVLATFEPMRSTAPGALEPATFAAGTPIDLAPAPTVKSSSSVTTGNSAFAEPGAIFLFLVGAVGVLLFVIAAVRTARFRSALRETRAAPPELVERTAFLSRELGLASPPRIRLSDAEISPVLWPGLGRCEIILPSRLLEDLTSSERDMLIAHELAHVRRRDHWIRPVELLVTTLYWWHPIVWWVRRKLRAAEEKSCDALVVRTFPERSRDYAEGLLKTAEFLSRPNLPISAFATGASGASPLKERLIMIFHENVPAAPSRRLRVAFAAAALGLLLVSPTWVAESAVRGELPGRSHTHVHDQDRERLFELRRAELELEKKMQALTAERVKLEVQRQEATLAREVATIRQREEELRRSGEKEAAEMARRRLEQLEKRAQLERERLEFEQVHTVKQVALALELEELRLRLDELSSDEELAEVRELRERERELEAALQTLQLKAMEHQLSQSAAALELEKLELEELRALE